MQYLINLHLQFLYTTHVKPQLEKKLKMFLRIALKLSLILGVITFLTFCVTKDNAGVVLRNFKSRRTLMKEIEAEENAAKANLQQISYTNENNSPLPEPDIKKLNVTVLSTNNSDFTNLTQAKKRLPQPKKSKKKSSILRLQKTPETKLSSDILKNVIPDPVERTISIINVTNSTDESGSLNFLKDGHLLNDSAQASSTKNKDSGEREILKFESTVNHLESASSKVIPKAGRKTEHAISESDLVEWGQIDKLSEEDLKILENDPCFLANKNYSQEMEGEIAKSTFCPESVFDVLDIDDAIFEDFSSDTNLTLVDEFLQELESELNETTEFKMHHNLSNGNIFNKSLNGTEDISTSNDSFLQNVSHVLAENKISQKETFDENTGRNLTDAIPEHEIIHLEPEPEINEGIVRPESKEHGKSESGISQKERNLTEHEIIHLESEPEINDGIVKPHEGELNTSGETNINTNIRGNLTENTSNVVENDIIHLEPEPEINEGIVKPGNDNKSDDINISKEAIGNSFNESQANDTGLGIESVVSSGIDFIMNTEVAKNAAMAMEVFNLTDSSLTDHVIEDNDMHGLIDIILPTSPEELEDNGLNTSETGSLTTKNKTLQSSIDENSNESHIENTSLLTTFNITSNMTQNVSILDLFKNKTVIENLSSLSKAKECPPSGICLFWFTSSDLCSDSSECPGEQICCTVRCFKDCIDV